MKDYWITRETLELIGKKWFVETYLNQLQEVKINK